MMTLTESCLAQNGAQNNCLVQNKSKNLEKSQKYAYDKRVEMTRWGQNDSFVYKVYLLSCNVNWTFPSVVSRSDVRIVR